MNGPSSWPGGPWTLVLIAATLEVGFALTLKASTGFTRPGPTLATLVLMAQELSNASKAC